MEKSKCHICKTSNKDREVCGHCGADLISINTEQLISKGGLQSQFSVSEGKFGWYQGETYLTSKRIIIIPIKMPGAGLSGMLTAKLINSLAPGAISLPLQDVESVELVSWQSGLLVRKQTLTIRTKDNHVLKVDPTKKHRETWKLEIERLIG